MFAKQTLTGLLAVSVSTAALAEPEKAISDGNNLMSQQITPAMARALDDRVPIAAIEELPDGATITIVSSNGRSRTGSLGEPIHEGDRVAVSNGSVNVVTINGQSITLDDGSSRRFRRNEFAIESSGSGGLSFIRKVLNYTADRIGSTEDPPEESLHGGPGIRG